MSFKNQKLCPFSKPIISLWCHCPYASIMEGCTGKMACNRDALFHISCNSLVDTLKKHSSFILGINNYETELTHSQTMRIRCGGILGMQRVMKIDVDSPPVIPDILSTSEIRYDNINNFPFNEIVQDIKTFCHRKKRH